MSNKIGIPKIPKPIIKKPVIKRPSIGIPKIPSYVPRYLNPLLKLADFSKGKIPPNLTKKQKEGIGLPSMISKFFTLTGKEVHLYSPSRRKYASFCGPGTHVLKRTYVQKNGKRMWHPWSKPIAPWDTLAFHHDLSFLEGNEAQRKVADKALSNGAKRLLRKGKFEYPDDLIIIWLIAQFF